MFAVSAGFGLDKMIEKYEAEHDDYKKIIAEAVAEALDVQDILRVKYQGIRPAPGYPSQPDHTEKQTMWDLIKPAEKAGIGLSDTLSMLPAASVSALVFAHPQS